MDEVARILAQLAVVVIMSALAFWRPHELLFLIISGIALMTGLGWYNAFPTDVGLSVSLMLIAYAFVAVGFGLKVMLWRSEEDEGGR